MHGHGSYISAVTLSASLTLFVLSMPQEKPMNYPFHHLLGKVSQLANLRVQYIFLSAIKFKGKEQVFESSKN